MKEFFIVFLFLVTAYSDLYSQGVWSKDTSTGFVERRSATSSVINGKIYAIGGKPFTGIAPVQIFDPILHQWSTPVINEDLNIGFWSTANVVNREIYVMGGLAFQNTGLGDTLCIFDPGSNSWNLPTITGFFAHRLDFTSSVVNGKIYVFGGQDSIIITTVDVFDPSTNTWATPVTTGTFTPRYGLSSAVVNGKIYVMGGNGGNASNYLPVSTMEVFDPATNSWSTPSTIGSLYPRQFFTSCVLDNKIYVIGGDIGGMINPTNSVQIFDPAMNSWTQLFADGNLTPRMQLTSCVVNGKIYVLGGYIPHQELNTVEVYDPNGSDVRTTTAANDRFSILSNPITSSADFQFDALKEPTVFELFDALGRSVLRRELPAGQASLHIDMQKYPSGIYFARLGGKVIRFAKM